MMEGVFDAIFFYHVLIQCCHSHVAGGSGCTSGGGPHGAMAAGAHDGHGGDGEVPGARGADCAGPENSG